MLPRALLNFLPVTSNPTSYYNIADEIVRWERYLWNLVTTVTIATTITPRSQLKANRCFGGKHSWFLAWLALRP
jgi:hypothetical protein